MPVERTVILVPLYLPVTLRNSLEEAVLSISEKYELTSSTLPGSPTRAGVSDEDHLVRQRLRTDVQMKHRPVAVDYQFRITYLSHNFLFK